MQYCPSLCSSVLGLPCQCCLQGHIWRQGYQSGQLKCELFSDVVPALQQWSDHGLRTYIYSSGSRLAQRDLFAHTSQGDVRHHLSGYFDTTSGAKVILVPACVILWQLLWNRQHNAW